MSWCQKSTNLPDGPKDPLRNGFLGAAAGASSSWVSTFDFGRVGVGAAASIEFRRKKLRRLGGGATTFSELSKFSDASAALVGVLVSGIVEGVEPLASPPPIDPRLWKKERALRGFAEEISKELLRLNRPGRGCPFGVTGGTSLSISTLVAEEAE